MSAYEDMPAPKVLTPLCPLRSCFNGGTYDQTFKARGCECDPKHELQCNDLEELADFMNEVASRVATHQKAAVVFYRRPNVDTATVVGEGEDWHMKRIDKETGEVVCVRLNDWLDPENCYLCKPLPGGERVEWEANLDTTRPRFAGV
jgi:hypothetical protein